MNKSEAEDSLRKVSEAMARNQAAEAMANTEKENLVLRQIREGKQNLEKKQAILRESGVIEILEAMIDKGVVKLSDDPKLDFSIKKERTKTVVKEGFLGIGREVYEKEVEVYRTGRQISEFSPAVIVVGKDLTSLRFCFGGARDLKDGDIVYGGTADIEKTGDPSLYPYWRYNYVEVRVGNDDKIHARGSVFRASDLVVGEDGDIYEVLGKVLLHPDTYIQRGDPNYVDDGCDPGWAMPY